MPQETATRAELAVIFANYGALAATEGNGQVAAMADAADVPQWACEAMDACLAQGILTGKPGNVLDPAGTASRAELAAMLLRAQNG